LKKENDNLVAGSVSVDSALTVTLTRVGENSTIGQIKSLISEAQKQNLILKKLLIMLRLG